MLRHRTRDSYPTHLRLDRLKDSLRRQGIKARTVRPWRSGVDCWVDLVSLDNGNTQVLRSPRVALMETSYDGMTDFGLVLQREAVALGCAANAGVPVPRVLKVHYGVPNDETSWMLQSLMEGDSSRPRRRSGSRLGRWIRTLHSVRPENEQLPAPENWADIVLRRIGRRLDAVREFADLPSSSSVLTPALNLLRSRQSHAISLLHLDIRSENVVYKSGRPVGLLDFTNAMIGDPLFELARIRCFGGLTEEFLHGYGTADATAPGLSQLLDLYELDASTLLTIVGRYETDDEALHQRNLSRTIQLCVRLSGSR